MSRLVVCKDLVDTQCNICELVHVSESRWNLRQATYQQRALDGIASTAANTPGTQKDCAGDCGTNQYGVYIANLREGGDSIEEVARARDDGG